MVVHAGPPPRGAGAKLDAVLQTCFQAPNEGLPPELPGSAAGADQRAMVEAFCKVRRIFNGDPVSSVPHHYCCGCCSSREETIQKAISAFMTFLEKHIVTPALTRWTSVWPVAGVITAMLSIHSLLRRAEQSLAGPRRADPGRRPDPEGGVGAPLDSTEYARQDRTRQLRLVQFLSATDTLDKLFIWSSIVGQLVRILHKWFEAGAIGNRSAGEFLKTCVLSRSLPVAVLAELMASLDVEALAGLGRRWVGGCGARDHESLNHESCGAR